MKHNTKTLTKKQIEARMNMYEEAAAHLEGSVTDPEVKEEREQANYVSHQIRLIADNFYKSKYYRLKNEL